MNCIIWLLFDIGNADQDFAGNSVVSVDLLAEYSPLVNMVAVFVLGPELFVVDRDFVVVCTLEMAGVEQSVLVGAECSVLQFVALVAAVEEVFVLVEHI